MSTCPACGGVIERDCFNPRECMEITRQMEAVCMSEKSGPYDGDQPVTQQRYDEVVRERDSLRAALERELSGAHRALIESEKEGRPDWARHFSRMENRISKALGQDIGSGETEP